MKFIFLIILALIVASGLAYQVHLEPGYALLTYGTLSIETSLAVLLFLTLMSFFAFYISLRAILTVKRTPKNISAWNQKRKQNNSRKALNKGLIDSAEGNWQRSEKLLIKNAPQSDTPLLNYLSAAHAAQSQGAYDRRDEHLFKAGEALPEQIHAIHLTRAKLQFSAGQTEQALATLQQLRSATPNHPIVLTLLLKTFQRLSDWSAVYNLLPALKNNRKIAHEEWQTVEHQTLLQLFSQTSSASKQDISTVWKDLGKQQKLNPDYLAGYASHLIKTGKAQLAEDLLIKGLSAEFSTPLLSLYSQLNVDTGKKIKQLEKWLKNHTADTALLNNLAELCFMQALWGKAKSYAETSLSVCPTSDAYLLLGNIHEQQDGSIEEANNCYKKGLELTTKTQSKPLVEV